MSASPSVGNGFVRACALSEVAPESALAVEIDGLEIAIVHSNGEVYASIDQGERWERLPGTLPPVLSVSCAVLP